MSYQYRPAKRENVPLLLGLAGGTGSGKTMSALRLAKGLAGDKRFAVLDTENGRASHYADEFDFDVGQLRAPYRPERYMEAIAAADEAGYPVVVIDSMSHEWSGDGGLLDWQTEEHEKSGGREAGKLSAWIKPKMAHRKFVSNLLQVKAHLILCFRAAERVEMVRNAETRKMEVIPKRSRTGLDGWVLITEKELPFELTASFLLTEDAPGVPKPIKLQEQHRLLIPLTRPLSEEAGAAFGAWAKGVQDESEKRCTDLSAELLDLADKLGKREKTTEGIQGNRAIDADLGRHAKWLEAQIRAARKKVEESSDPQADLSFDEPVAA